MPEALPKYIEISGELVDYLKYRNKLDDFSFHKYIREIEKLNDPLSEDYLKALACAANGRQEDAILFFEEALRLGIDTYALNYATYLSDYGTHKQLSALTKRLIGTYGSKTMLTFAWETNLFSGNIDQALIYAERFIDAADKKDAEKMKEDSVDIVIDTARFKESSSLTHEQYMFVAQSMLDIADNYNVRPASIAFVFVPEENTASYIMTLKTNDIDVISDMNLDIAFSLAENDSLLGKNFSVWYQGLEEVDSHACN